MNIRLKTIPHERQRYETVGDWIVSNGVLKEIRVSNMGNDEYAFLVGIHELIESQLCLKKGISQKEVDHFDKVYELCRHNKIKNDCGCKITKTSEPGDDKHAPYFKEHQFATKIEKMLAMQMKISWEKYDNVVVNL